MMKWLTITSWGLSVIGLTVFGYSLTQQTKIQLQMNQTMAQIDTSLGETTPLVSATSNALQPLVGTTLALANIERQEQLTTNDLFAMNQHLRTIANTERGILVELHNLDDVTTQVSQNIAAVSSVNQGIFSTSQTAASQAGEEAGQVGSLNQQTQTATAQLHTLNHKLSALKLLP